MCHAFPAGSLSRTAAETCACWGSTYGSWNSIARLHSHASYQGCESLALRSRTLAQSHHWQRKKARGKQRARVAAPATSGGCQDHVTGTPSAGYAGRSISNTSSSRQTLLQPAAPLAAAVVTAGAAVLRGAARPAALTPAGQCRMMTHTCSGGCCGGCLASCHLLHRPCTPSTLECAHTVLIEGEMHGRGSPKSCRTVINTIIFDSSVGRMLPCDCP
jgi:hypothetical protein